MIFLFRNLFSVLNLFVVVFDGPVFSLPDLSKCSFTYPVASVFVSVLMLCEVSGRLLPLHVSLRHIKGVGSVFAEGQGQIYKAVQDLISNGCISEVSVVCWGGGRCQFFLPIQPSLLLSSK